MNQKMHTNEKRQSGMNSFIYPVILQTFTMHVLYDILLILKYRVKTCRISLILRWIFFPHILASLKLKSPYISGVLQL